MCDSLDEAWESTRLRFAVSANQVNSCQTKLRKFVPIDHRPDGAAGSYKFCTIYCCVCETVVGPVVLGQDAVDTTNYGVL